MTLEQIEGMQARANGNPFSHNPYQKIQGEEWLKGWRLLDERISCHISDAQAMLQDIRSMRQRSTRSTVLARR